MSGERLKVIVNEDENENEYADAREASVAFGPYGRRTLFATTEALALQRSETCRPLSKTASGVCELNENENENLQRGCWLIVTMSLIKG